MKKALKRSLSFLLAITIIFGSMCVGLGKIYINSLFAVEVKAASSGTCGDNIAWTFDDEGKLTITGTGDMPNYSSYSNVPWYSACSNITRVVIDNGVTNVGNFAFRECENLTSITIPDSVTSIGTSAFEDCTIYCYRDTYAMQYAINHLLNYVLIDIGETANSTNDYENNLIYTDIEGITSLDDIIYTSATSAISVQVRLVSGNTEFLGPGSTVTVFDADTFSEYTLVVEGDTNGDSVCDALDAWQVGLVSNGHEALDGAYALAADNNADDIVDVTDCQAIVNKVVS